MYLTAVTQRERVFEAAMRWLRGRLDPADGRFLTLAFLLDPFITAPVVTGFLRDVAAPEGAMARVERVRFKGDVRERIALGCRRQTPRTSELLARYRECPERFYPTTPVDLVTVTSGERDLLAMVRFKNIQRIADKVSRRATARFSDEIWRRAEALAGRKGPLSATTDVEAVAEAERQVCLDIARGALTFTRRDLLIGDLIGAKLIGERHELALLEEKVAAHPQVVSVRRSEHHGIYNDTRLDVELACPPPGATIDRLLAWEWPHAAKRGLTPAALHREIPSYVASAERTFFLEIILTTWDDLVESEFGRGLHEERTERQRDDLRWARQLSTNVAMTVAFMLLVAVAPRTGVEGLPVKLNGRYLPDTMATVFSRLFDLDIDIDRSPLWLPHADDESLTGSGAPAGRPDPAGREAPSSDPSATPGPEPLAAAGGGVPWAR